MNTSQTTILNRTCHYMIAGELMLGAPIALAQDGNTTLSTRRSHLSRRRPSRTVEKV